MTRTVLLRSLLLASLLFALEAAPTGAIIGGEFDGNRHPYVAVLLAPNYGGLCSGTAISPTLVVTAAHCFHSELGPTLYVSFDADVFGSKDGDPVPHFVRGTIHPDLRFCQGCGPAPTAGPGYLAYDTAVVVLDQPVALARYASLPSKGQIDTFVQKTRLEIVGYGLNAPEKLFDYSTDTIPRNAVGADLQPGKAFLGQDWVRLSANPAQDKGRVCFGDSGGPALLGDTILATTSLVLNDMCIGVSFSHRLDTADALAFIGQFMH